MRGTGGRNNALAYYQDRYRHRGSGVGSIFSSLFSSVVPLFKTAAKIGMKAIRTPVGRALAKEAKRTAMQAGLNVVHDALQGKNVVHSTKNEMKRIKNNIPSSVERIAKRAMTSQKVVKKKRKLKKVIATSAGVVKRQNLKAGGKKSSLFAVSKRIGAYSLAKKRKSQSKRQKRRRAERDLFGMI